MYLPYQSFILNINWTAPKINIYSFYHNHVKNWKPLIVFYIDSQKIIRVSSSEILSTILIDKNTDKKLLTGVYFIHLLKVFWFWFYFIMNLI